MNKVIRNQEELTYLSSYFSKQLKQKFGKGPEACFTSFKDNVMLIHIKNFITPAEEVLLESKENHLAFTFRKVIIKRIMKEVRKEVNHVLQVNMTNFYDVWNFKRNMGLIMLIDSRFEVGKYQLDNEQLKETIEHISGRVQRTPTDITALQVSAKTYVVECSGVLLPIDRKLYQRGYHNILQERLEEIVQEYNNKKGELSAYFKQSIEDIFITFDYKNDKKFISFYFQ